MRLRAGLAARQVAQHARHPSAALSVGRATRQTQRSFGPMGVQAARASGVEMHSECRQLQEELAEAVRRKFVWAPGEVQYGLLKLAKIRNRGIKGHVLLDLSPNHGPRIVWVRNLLESHACV